MIFKTKFKSLNNINTTASDLNAFRSIYFVITYVLIINPSDCLAIQDTTSKPLRSKKN